MGRETPRLGPVGRGIAGTGSSGLPVSPWHSGSVTRRDHQCLPRAIGKPEAGFVLVTVSAVPGRVSPAGPALPVTL